jgi:predicted transporter
MTEKKMSGILRSSTAKFGVLAAGSAVFIGMPCPCCGGTACAVGILSAAATGAAVNASGIVIKSLKEKLSGKKI